MRDHYPTPDLLASYLAEHIPITMALGVEIRQATPERVLLSAPFKPNINHKNTIFGGSLHAVATLSCWSMLFIHLKKWAVPMEIVILRSEVDYLMPVTMDFEAECRFPASDAWMKFEKVLMKKGKAKIALTATIYQKGRLAVNYQGVFVALKASQ